MTSLDSLKKTVGTDKLSFREVFEQLQEFRRHIPTATVVLYTYDLHFFFLEISENGTLPVLALPLKLTQNPRPHHLPATRTLLKE